MLKRLLGWVGVSATPPPDPSPSHWSSQSQDSSGEEEDCSESGSSERMDWEFRLLTLAMQLAGPRNADARTKYRSMTKTSLKTIRWLTDGPDRSDSEDTLYSGSRLEHLGLDVYCGYSKFNRPDTDCMIMQPLIYDVSIDGAAGLQFVPGPPGFGVINADASQLEIEVSRHLTEDQQYLDTASVRQAGMAIMFTGDEDQHGPATTEYNDDWVTTLVCTAPFREMSDFRSRRRSRTWHRTFPLDQICKLPGLLVCTSYKGSPLDVQAHQFRQSFSAVEILLLRATPAWALQAGRLFKYVVKRLLPSWTPGEGEGDICSYHLKTTLMWTLEELSDQDWDDASPAKLLLTLLEKLVYFLQQGTLPGYWVPDCNLIQFVPAARMKAIISRIQKTLRHRIPYAAVLSAPEHPDKAWGRSRDEVETIFAQISESGWDGRDTRQSEALLQLLADSAVHTISGMVKAGWLERTILEFLRQVGSVVAGQAEVWFEVSGQRQQEERGYQIAAQLVGKMLEKQGVMLAAMTLSAITESLLNEGWPELAGGFAVVAACLHQYRLETDRRSEDAHLLMMCHLDEALEILEKDKVLGLLSLTWKEHYWENVPDRSSSYQRFDRCRAVVIKAAQAQNKDFSSYAARFNSFGPSNRNSQLPKAGFYFGATSGLIKCFCCGFTCDAVCANENPLEQHFADCSFAERARLRDKFSPDEEEELDYPSFSSLLTRMESFLDWSEEDPQNKQQLATAGWINRVGSAEDYGDEDEPPMALVTCFSCGRGYPDVRATMRHSRKCKFAQTKNLPMKTGRRH